MSKPHIHADYIKQWADGTIIQYLFDDREARWIECHNNHPQWRPDTKYLVNPQTIKFRNYLRKCESGKLSVDLVIGDDCHIGLVEKAEYFKGWIGDIQEVTP